jgi:Domain of unknown function (DUF4123)
MTDHIRYQLETWIGSAELRSIRSYLVLDGSWQEHLVTQARASAAGWEPLLGEAGEHKNEAHRRSPLVVDIAERQELLGPWLSDGFQHRLGIIVFSKLGLQEIRASLKRFIRLTLPDSKKASYFRFFDARALHCFLATGFPAQWLDFMEGIELIAAPADFCRNWSAYRMSGTALQIGVSADDSFELAWQPLEAVGDDPAYQAAFPFRRVDEPQYSALLACSDRAFSIEIAQFLQGAFPAAAGGVTRRELLDFVSEARRAGAGQGYDTEDSQFYFAVLAFMGGIDFYLRPETYNFLQFNHADPTAKLETLLQQVCRSMDNPKLVELVDKTEVTVTYASGRQTRHRKFSGKTLSW